MRSSTSAPSSAVPDEERSDRAYQRVGELQRVASRDVEAVEEPTSDEFEISRRRGADLAAEGLQLVEHRLGVAVGLEERACSGIGLKRGDEPPELV